MDAHLFGQRVERDRSLGYIAVGVVAIHLLFAGSVAYLFKDRPLQRPAERRLAVQTVRLRETSPVVRVRKKEAPTVSGKVEEEPRALMSELVPEHVEKAPPEPVVRQEVKAPSPPAMERPAVKPAPVKPVVTTKPKVVVAKKTQAVPVKRGEAVPVGKKSAASPVKPQKAAVQQKKDSAAEAVKVKRQQLLAEAQKSIAQIDRASDPVKTVAKSSAVANIPGTIEHLQVETLGEGACGGEFTVQEMRYYEELASHLKRQLRLPEYGQVRIKLSLERSGKFLEASVMHAESKKNRQYLEQMLPKLKYPGFGTQFAADQHTFIIAFSNEG